VIAHLQNRETPDFQPSNVTWGSFDGGGARRAQDDRLLSKRERRRKLAERALAAIESLAAETLFVPVG
jgi:folate-dependent tRNA-U54 methylase TrmFO/GidA